MKEPRKNEKIEGARERISLELPAETLRIIRAHARAARRPYAGVIRDALNAKAEELAC